MLAVERLKGLLDGTEMEAEYNGVVLANDGGKITVSATGLFTPSVSFSLNDIQLRLLRRFLELKDELVLIFKRENGIRLGFDGWYDVQTTLDLLADGTSIVSVYFCGPMALSKWTVFPDGTVQYKGEFDGRGMPDWVEKALTGG